MKRAIHLACFFAMGAVLNSAGITLTDWQLYVVIALVAAASITSEIME